MNGLFLRSLESEGSFEVKWHLLPQKLCLLVYEASLMTKKHIRIL